jgi:hypothetical protein
MQKTQWFNDRVGQVVMRISPNGSTKTFQIENENVAEYADSLQTHGYKFKELVNVSTTPNVCTACEG